MGTTRTMQTILSLLIGTAIAQECLQKYTMGKEMKDHCMPPECMEKGVDYEVVDKWQKKMGRSWKFGWIIKINVAGKNLVDGNGWSILMRFNGTQGDMNIWNANVRNVYRWEEEGTIDFLLQQKYWTKNDLEDEDSFIVAINRVTDDVEPELYFWSTRQSNDKCFRSGTRSTAAFQQAIAVKKRVNDFEDVSKLVIHRTGTMRVDV